MQRRAYDRDERLPGPPAPLASTGMLLPRQPSRPRAAAAHALAHRMRDRYRARRARPVTVPVRLDEPDVSLDVGQLHVGKIELKVDELTARVALDARVLDMVQINVGV